MYSFKQLLRQKPATVAAAIGSILTTVHLAWEANGGSPLSGDVVAGIVSGLGLLLALFWIDPSTVNVDQAVEEKDAAFLEGLALPNSDKTREELKQVAKTKPARQRRARKDPPT